MFVRKQINNTFLFKMDNDKFFEYINDKFNISKKNYDFLKSSKVEIIEAEIDNNINIMFDIYFNIKNNNDKEKFINEFLKINK